MLNNYLGNVYTLNIFLDRVFILFIAKLLIEFVSYLLYSDIVFSSSLLLKLSILFHKEFQCLAILSVSTIFSLCILHVLNSHDVYIKKSVYIHPHTLYIFLYSTHMIQFFFFIQLMWYKNSFCIQLQWHNFFSVFNRYDIKKIGIKNSFCIYFPWYKLFKPNSSKSCSFLLCESNKIEKKIFWRLNSKDANIFSSKYYRENSYMRACCWKVVDVKNHTIFWNTICSEIHSDKF